MFREGPANLRTISQAAKGIDKLSCIACNNIILKFRNGRLAGSTIELTSRAIE